MEGDDQADIVVVGLEESFQCPVTMMELVEPVRSPLCGHCYSKNGILSLFQQQRSAVIRCPVAGNCMLVLPVCISNTFMLYSLWS